MDWSAAAIWMGLAVVAALLSIWFRVSVALTEILVGVAAGALIGKVALHTTASWVTFLAGVGSVVLTFLAGAELDPETLKRSWKEAFAIGLAGFFAPFLGSAFVAHALLGWDPRASWLAGVALSTTSVAVVYAVMLELGLNQTPFGKVILAACFVNDLGTVLALGLLFAPFGTATWVFALGLGVGLYLLIRATPWLFARYGGSTHELEAKFLLFALFALGALAAWSGSEAVLPAYLVGMVLAGSVGKDHALIRRLRTLTLGLLTPFYFIRAGSLVSLPALLLGLGGFFVLLLTKMASKVLGVYPITLVFRYRRRDAAYTTLLMSTGLTFGTISSLYGLTHGIISEDQYSLLVAAVIASAVVPTWIANRFFLPHHHIQAARIGLEEVRNEG
ncbi:cation:proton antiporter [Thermus scotoductus]|uniref:cation:proton antiporter n=1 Tax=Thermus scotoductus TaxID=37636 RepID=UPI00056E1FB6|nr:cation:proton antiporter [Thermus scotoductus]